MDIVLESQIEIQNYPVSSNVFTERKIALLCLSLGNQTAKPSALFRKRAGEVWLLHKLTVCC
jgi:hypothetical protein